MWILELVLLSLNGHDASDYHVWVHSLLSGKCLRKCCCLYMHVCQREIDCLRVSSFASRCCGCHWSSFTAWCLYLPVWSASVCLVRVFCMCYWKIHTRACILFSGSLCLLELKVCLIGTLHVGVSIHSAFISAGEKWYVYSVPQLTIFLVQKTTY